MDGRSRVWVSNFIVGYTHETGGVRSPIGRDIVQLPLINFNWWMGIIFFALHSPFFETIKQCKNSHQNNHYNMLESTASLYEPGEDCGWGIDIPTQQRGAGQYYFFIVLPC